MGILGIVHIMGELQSGGRVQGFGAEARERCRDLGS